MKKIETKSMPAKKRSTRATDVRPDDALAQQAAAVQALARVSGGLAVADQHDAAQA